MIRGLSVGTGWPRAVACPGLPQNRTCAINAFGSSNDAFATRGGSNGPPSHEDRLRRPSRSDPWQSKAVLGGLSVERGVASRSGAVLGVREVAPLAHEYERFLISRLIG